MPDGLFYPYQMGESICHLGVSGLVSFYHFYSIYVEITNLPYANSVDPDYTPRNAASDRGLHCLHIAVSDLVLHCMPDLFMER